MAKSHKYQILFIFFRVALRRCQHLKAPRPECASELYRPSESRSSAKLEPTFVDRGCHVISVTDPYGRILWFLDWSRYFFFQVAPRVYSRGWADPVPDPGTLTPKPPSYLSEIRLNIILPPIYTSSWWYFSSAFPSEPYKQSSLQSMPPTCSAHLLRLGLFIPISKNALKW
jgi:hypothetical protein